ncbi:MAG: aminoglycoside phosphotransferase family protein [Cytophagales bacterium]|jgi:thiamine kinase-like enzyme|nr:aminoglycoside phosphotransferase family protein [Cytophagales bacterium]MCA6389548.1 aminoglycoside phosphotransferase family protein [Cytophagales bacterium]MCA6392672.1 aminoglycoside phosphotransferase family protein [Cytophagales bacterium]MCA6399321.1 aminoglycoside phosphotransferase family protein [Cytophagales bacterium]MCA6402081.1 aminoglycoside phosphotransferase family protein [Cytophagales bacterium]
MNSILQQFGSQFQNASLEPISGGLINQTWKVSAKGESFVLQRINDTIFKEPAKIATNVRLLADHLASIGSDYFLVSPIRTERGEELAYETGKGYFRLTPFVKNSKTIQVVETPEQAYEAALQFGKFSSTFSDFDAKQLHVTIPNFHDLAYRYKQFENALLTGNPQRISACYEEINQKRSYARLVDEYNRILRNPVFKLRVTHHDTKISNVLFDLNNKGVCVIDLDTVMPGYFFSDVGDMMRTYLSPTNEEETDFSKIEVRPMFYHAIVQGYSEGMKGALSIEEQNSFFLAGQILIYMQSLRFLTDYFNNDVYYGAQFEGQNLIRAQNQLSLYSAFVRARKSQEI